MKLLIPCMKCLQEYGQPTGEFCRVEFCDDGRYEITCSHGHETITVLQQQKFEVLFDIGAHAIIDGYYREAVSSFTSSLERFYEFSIRTFMEKSESSDAVCQSCWKTISNQSERQLGAFIFLWAYCLGESPELLSNSQINFRNEVIHKGKIPTRHEALEYGNAILEVLRPKMRLLQQRFPEEVSKVIFWHLRGSQSYVAENKQVATMSVQTIISLMAGEESHHQKTLEESLLGLNEWRRRVDGF